MEKTQGNDFIKKLETNTGRTVLWDVADDLVERAKFGIKKYDKMLKTDNGRDALIDAYNQALDLVMYLKQAIIERDEEE